MTKFRFASCALIAVAAVLASAHAQAALITKTLTLTASGFGAGAPVDPVSIEFSISFDNATDIQSTNSGLTILSTNLTNYVINYAYNAQADRLTLGTIVGPYGYATYWNSNHVATYINLISTDGLFASKVDYTTNGVSQTFSSTASSVTAASAAVPEPATWGMFIGGFGLMGAAMRRKKAIVRFA